SWSLRMLKQIAFALLLGGFAFAQTYPVEEHLDDVTKVTCKSELPKGFACAILFNLDPPFVDGIGIASVAGAGTDVAPNPSRLISKVSLILNGTLYTAVYDPPLERHEKFSSLGKNVGIPARVDGDDLIVKWPDGKPAKARIICREKINSNS